MGNASFVLNFKKKKKSHLLKKLKHKNLEYSSFIERCKNNFRIGYGKNERERKLNVICI